MPKDFTSQNDTTWQDLVSRYGTQGVGPPTGLGFHTQGFPATPGVRLPVIAPAGQYYVYPDGGRSNVPGPGAMGPFSDEESLSKAAAIMAAKPVPTSTTQTTTQAMDAATMAANPRMITPYMRSLSMGGGAYGESDILGKKTIL